MRPCQGEVLTCDMALKQRHKTDEMVTEKHKDGLNIDRDIVYSSK